MNELLPNPVDRLSYNHRVEIYCFPKLDTRIAVTELILS